MKANQTILFEDIDPLVLQCEGLYVLRRKTKAFGRTWHKHVNSVSLKLYISFVGTRSRGAPMLKTPSNAVLGLLFTLYTCVRARVEGGRNILY